MKIVGHTDNTGSSQHNQVLSENRARSVMNYFVNQGVAPSRVATTGKGEVAPIATNETQSGRATNRRTELLFK